MTLVDCPLAEPDTLPPPTQPMGASREPVTVVTAPAATPLCLLVLADGRGYLETAMLSVAEHVGLSRFSSLVMVDDSQDPEFGAHVDDLYGDRFSIWHAPTQLGADGAIAAGWERVPWDAAYVLHLQDRWRIEGWVPVDEIVATMERNRDLAQMALRGEFERTGLEAALPCAEGGVWTPTRGFVTSPCVYPRKVAEGGWRGAVTDSALRREGWRFGMWGTPLDAPLVTWVDPAV